MHVLLLIIEFISAVLVIGAVLIHSPKGEGLAGIGAQARLYQSSRGMESGLNMFTGTVTAVFVLSALLLSILS